MTRRRDDIALRETEASFSRRDLLKLLASGSALLLVHCGPVPPPPGEKRGASYDWTKHYWVYVVDISKCIGCCACMRACRAENDVPEGYHRTWIERYRIRKDGEVLIDVAQTGEHVFAEVKDEVERAYFVPKICNHCTASPCTQVCPVGASYQTKDGVVLVDDKACVGCGYCVQACPYGTRYLHPTTRVADKCTLCYHRITRGEKPACVAMCPTGARMFGDLKNPDDPITRLLKDTRTRFIKAELGTKPKCHYIGLDEEVI
ncbi:MAG: 4Fe-4S dicluster domain-containing protein [Deltaproteobacteria bacterium]|nr:4Fe-4S dicluster domain-containing protein [Deltaproteobacteria bacterium]